MKWSKIEDQSPLLGLTSTVLFSTGADVYCGHADLDKTNDRLVWYDDTSCDWDGNSQEVWHVTHWMPLPSPPL
jgi:hypothetical protein